MIVKDVLSFGGLRDARIVAGIDGINNEVTSISVLEVAEEKIKTWVLENQLYITSFYAIVQDIERQRIVISALNEKKASGLVICHIDLFIKEIHPEIIELCNELKFPLIVANSKRSYIEILNPIIFRLMENSDPEYGTVIDMQNKLIEHIATKRDADYVYKAMSKEYGKKIYFLDINNEAIYPKYEEGLFRIIDLVSNYQYLIEEEYKKSGYCIIDRGTVKNIVIPIECNGLYYGTIVTEYEENDVDRRIRILESIVSLCTLIFTKNSRIEEREIVRKQEYISDLITWNFRTDEVAIKMGQDIGWNILNKCKMIVVNLNDIQKSIEINNKDFLKFINEVLYNKIKYVIRNDNKHNIMGLRSDMFLILLESDGKETYQRAKNLGDKILRCCQNNFKGSVSIGISGDVGSYKDIPNAYIQATDAAKIGRHFLGDNKVVSFEDIGFYGIFKKFYNINSFESTKKNIFKDLKQYDIEQNSDLYITLKALIYNNMNTKAAAEELYLHSNTVNYRKNKIVEILGYKPWEMPYLLNTLIAIVAEFFEK